MDGPEKASLVTAKFEWVIYADPMLLFSAYITVYITLKSHILAAKQISRAI
jgi:hypothetical protein